jgi:glutamate synthase domain-containing protein 1
VFSDCNDAEWSGGMIKEGQVRIPSGCAISGVISRDGSPVGGREIITSIATMHERSNGLGGGFAGYGIYPQYAEYYALHLFYDGTDAKAACEKYLEEYFDILNLSKIPVRKTRGVHDAPLIWRYFVAPLSNRLAERHYGEDEYVARRVLHINAEIDGAYVFSSGKNMGVFKGVGFPEDIGEFFRLDEYEGYCWTAHGRYPTNTPGWWGGAHPFALLDYSIVHNGEISSYDANRRHMEMLGYRCTLLTDTEVITYMIDHLVRGQGMTLEEAAGVIAAPFWSTIERMPPDEAAQAKYLRSAFSSFLITGPFSILLGFTGGLMALNDRLKLRSMVVAEKGARAYIASEECAIRAMEPDLDTIWSPKGGEPVIFRLNETAKA